MNAMMKVVLMSACLIALAACGSDDSEDGGNAGSGGAGGESGSSGASGAGEGGTGGGGMMAEPVVCGGETCGAPSNARLRACCVAETNECGEMVPGGIFGPCAVPVEPHPDCESAMLGTFVIPSCCSADSRCGIAAMRLFDEPCTSIEDIIALAADAGAGEGDGGAADGGGGGISFGENLPAPAACTP